MKKLICCAFAFFSSITFGYTQKKEDCYKCNSNKGFNSYSDDKVAELYLNKYSDTDDKRKIICDNIGEFFGENLDSKLSPLTAKSHYLSLRFDGIGCVYPDFIDKSYSNFWKVNDKLKNARFIKDTFYSIFYEQKNDITFTRKNNSQIFERFFPSNYQNKNALKESILPNDNTEPEKWDYFGFIKIWNEIFLNEYITKVQDIITKNRIKRVVFIVHGYNLPYNLAHIQANNIMETYQNLIPTDFQSTLFIKIYWPSLNDKKIKFDENQMRFKNKTSINTVKNFKYVLNRAYLTGLSLRKIFNSLENDKQVESVDFIGHSMGCPTITSVFINPFTKLNTDNNESVKTINENYFKVFNENKLVQKSFSVNIFLNASAMPGLITFDKENSTDEVLKNINWTIGYNTNDKVLRKTVSIFRFGDNNGNTRLGGNWDDEVWKTKDYIGENQIWGNVNFIKTGVQRDTFGHDFFCYLQQPLFKEAFEKFIKGN